VCDPPEHSLNLGLSLAQQLLPHGAQINTKVKGELVVVER
jgi:hypothetical protein